MAVYDSYIYTSPGGRDCNEDAVGEKMLSSGQMFLLADGLGGHQRGELASRCVVEAMKHAPEPEEDQDLLQWLAQQVQYTNDKLLELRASTHWGMKSTLVALLLRDDRATWAHVGDSRLYYFHGGRLEFVTSDHSVAFAKYKREEITRGQIARDEDQSSLLRALGNPERYQPDLGQSQENVQPGDGFLLCSDGVWEYLYDEEILIDLLKTETAQEWGEMLLLRVMERVQSGNDNLSLIAVRAV